VEVEIRAMTAADWESVRAIYLAGIATRQATFETDAPSWANWNNSHLPQARLTAIANENIVGWAALSPVSSRSVYQGVAETSVYVDSKTRGNGVGKLLLQALVEESERSGIWTLQASIFPENLASISIHKLCGFHQVGTRERIAKMNGLWRDTWLFERRSRVVGTD
jgi:phosphinothricin acetyltransferase